MSCLPFLVASTISATDDPLPSMTSNVPTWRKSSSLFFLLFSAALPWLASEGVPLRISAAETMPLTIRLATARKITNRVLVRFLPSARIFPPKSGWPGPAVGLVEGSKLQVTWLGSGDERGGAREVEQ